MKEKPLTDKQELFCREYIYDFNGSRAYKAAYPSIKADLSARVNASKLLTKTNIQAYIAELQSDLIKATGLTKIKILKEHAKYAFDLTVKADVRDRQNSLDSISKMLGHNEPKKIDVTGIIETIDTSKYTDEEKAILLKAARKDAHIE